MAKIVMMCVVVCVLLLVLNLSNVSCDVHRRHQYHYMHRQQSTTQTPARPLMKLANINRGANQYDGESMARPVITTTTTLPTPVRREYDKSRIWEQEQAILNTHPEMLGDDWMTVYEEDDDDSEDSAEEEYDHKKETLTRHQKDGAAAATAGVSTFSNFKFQQLGSRQDVAKMRSKLLASEKEYKAAFQHAVRIHQEGQCQQPKARLIRVSEVYPNSSKTYFPSCTILHQCGDDTGCCSYEGMTCVAKHSHRVELYFYAFIISDSSSSSTVERLLFYNHTECECKDRETIRETISRDTTRHESGSPTATLDDRHRFPAYTPPPAALVVKPPMHHISSSRSFRNSENDKMVANKGCRCPSEYSVRYLANGTCVCDCFDKQRECLRFKKGRSIFSAADRNCVMRRECREPACEYGAYISISGRCPVKWEQFGMIFRHVTAESKPVEHPKPVAPPAHLPWSHKSSAIERPLPLSEHQKPSFSLTHMNRSLWDSPRHASASHWTPSSTDMKHPSSYVPSRAQPSRSSSHHDPAKPVSSSWSSSRAGLLTPSWSVDQSKVSQQYPSWSSSSDSSSRSGFPSSRTELSRSSIGGYPWNPAEIARKPVSASNIWSLPKSNSSTTWGARNTRDTRVQSSNV